MLPMLTLHFGVRTASTLTRRGVPVHKVSSQGSGSPGPGRALSCQVSPPPASAGSSADSKLFHFCACPRSPAQGLHGAGWEQLSAGWGRHVREEVGGLWAGELVHGGCRTGSGSGGQGCPGLGDAWGWQRHLVSVSRAQPSRRWPQPEPAGLSLAGLDTAVHVRPGPSASPCRQGRGICGGTSPGDTRHPSPAQRASGGQAASAPEESAASEARAPLAACLLLLPQQQGCHLPASVLRVAPAVCGSQGSPRFVGKSRAQRGSSCRGPVTRRGLCEEPVAHFRKDKDR